MSSEVPELFDPVKACLLSARAQKIGPAPFLLERASEDLADRLQVILRPFDQILDLGTPEGAFGTMMRASGRGPRIMHATDVATPLIATPSHDDASRFDLIVSGMLFHRINDLPGLLIQIRRALNPDGLMMAVFPGGDTLTELRQILLQAESELTGGASMRVAPFIDVRAAGQLLQRTGYALPVVDSEKITVRYDSMFGLIKDLRAMASTAGLLKRQVVPGSPALFARAATLYAEQFSDGDGRIRATFEMIWVSGWAPHESQQKPLKPGSAKARLADALRGISETGEQ